MRILEFVVNERRKAIDLDEVREVREGINMSYVDVGFKGQRDLQILEPIPLTFAEFLSHWLFDLPMLRE